MTAVGRNDPCPCGSGKKYKRCCNGKSAERIDFEKYLAEFEEATSGYDPASAIFHVSKASYAQLGHLGVTKKDDGRPVPGTDFAELAKFFILGSVREGEDMNPDKYVECERLVIHSPRMGFMDDFDAGKAELTLVRMGFFQHKYTRQMMHLIGRACLLYQCFTELKADESRYDLHKEIEEALGMTPAQFIAIGTQFLISLQTFKGQISLDWFQGAKGKLKEILEPDKVDRFLAECSITPEGFKEECEKWELPDELREYAFNPLMTYPIIESGSDEKGKEYLVPLAYLLLLKFTEGLYHTLVNRFPPDSSESKDFRDNFGKNILEPYVTRHIREAVSKKRIWTGHTVHDRYRPSDLYAEIDHLVFEKGVWFIFETTTATASIRVQQVNPEERFFKYIEDLTDKILQLRKMHNLFEDGDDRLPVNIEAGAKHYCTLITLEDLPFPNILIRHFIELELQRRNEASFDYQIIDLNELETLCEVARKIGFKKIYSMKVDEVEGFDILNARQVAQFIIAKKMEISASLENFDNNDVPEWRESKYSNMQEFIERRFSSKCIPHFSTLLQDAYFRLYEDLGMKTTKNPWRRIKRKYALKIRSWLRGYRIDR